MNSFLYKHCASCGQQILYDEIRCEEHELDHSELEAEALVIDTQELEILQNPPAKGDAE